MNNTLVTVLKPKNFRGFPPNVVCFGLNYITHRIMVCTKEDLCLYDLENQSVLETINYVKKFEKLYEYEVRIRSIEAIILSDLWVTFVNKKSFLFFNDRLEFSKIYPAEPNPAISMQIVQRNNDIITLRGDRKILKIWRFEYTESSDEKNGQKADKEGKDPSKDKQSGAQKRFLDYIKKNAKAEVDLEKQRAMMNKGQLFEIHLYTRKNITMDHNRLILNITFSEELNLIVVSMDNMEIAIHNLRSCEHIQTVSFSNRPGSDIFNLPAIVIEQEFLYYCDERNFVIYDLLLNQEICNYQHMLPSKVVSIHAERSNPNGGLYFVTADEKLYVYSLSKKQILWSEDIETGSEAFDVPFTHATASPIKKTDLGPNRGKWSRSYSEYPKKDLPWKEQFYRAQSRLCTLFFSAYGRFMNKAYNIINPGKVCFEADQEITKFQLIPPPEEEVDDDNAPPDTQIARISFSDDNICNYKIPAFTEMADTCLDLDHICRTATYEPQSKKQITENIDPLEISSIHPLVEENILVAFTREHIHVVSMTFKKRMMHKINYTDATTCIAIRLNPDSIFLYLKLRFIRIVTSKYYIIVGTAKGVIVVTECDFAFKQFVVLKTMIRHDHVLCLRYLPDLKYMVSIGQEGNILVFDATPRERESSMLFNLLQSHKLIWNNVTSAIFLDDNKIIAGLDQGAIQYLRFSWKDNARLDSEIFNYHEAPVVNISAISQPSEQFVCACEEGLVSYWEIGRETPIKVFRILDQIISILITKNPLNAKPDLYVASKYFIYTLDLSFGGKVLTISQEEKNFWNEAIVTRFKHSTKIIRESKTFTPLISEALEALKTIKQAKKEINSGPILLKHLLRVEDGGFKSLEIDFWRYVTTEKSMRKKNYIWILDNILNEYLERRINGEPLISKQDGKGDRRDGAPILQNLEKTLKKYPIIRSIMVEKFKEKELLEMHKNVVLLLNHAYDGEDDIEEQYKFLEKNYDFKREDLNDAYFMRAKALYTKKPAKPKSPLKLEDQSALKLPQINQEPSPVKTKVILKMFHNSSATPNIRAKNAVSSFKNYNANLEKELIRPTKPAHEIFRTLIDKSTENKVLARRNPYRAYSSQKSHYQKFNFTSTVNPQTSTSGFFSMTSHLDRSNDTLAIGQNVNTITAPTFTTSRSEFYKTPFLTEPKIRKEYKGLDNNLTIEFPKRNNKNFVSSHSQGFAVRENRDLYKHVLRHLIRNQHLLGKKQDNKKKETEKTSKEKEEEDSDIEYIPLAVKQFILESSKEHMALLDQIPNLYELKMGNQLLDDSPTKPDYEAADIEDKLEKENEFLEEILEKINEKGIEAVNLDNMIKFKRIVKRRMEIFTKLEDYIQSSGVLEKGTQDPKTHHMKEELLETVNRIQKIRSNLGIDQIPKKVLYSSIESQKTLSRHHSKCEKQATPENNESQTRRMVGTILQSIGTFKEVNEEILNVSKKKSSETGAENPISLLFGQGQTSLGISQPSSPLKSARDNVKNESSDDLSKFPVNSNQMIQSLSASPIKRINTAFYQSDQGLNSGYNLKRCATTSDPNQNNEDESPTGSVTADKNQDPFADLKVPAKKKKNPNLNVNSGNLVTLINNDHEKKAELLRKYRTLRVERPSPKDDFEEGKESATHANTFTNFSDLSPDLKSKQNKGTPSFKALGSALTPHVFTRSNDEINISMIMKEKRSMLRSRTALLPPTRSVKNVLNEADEYKNRSTVKLNASATYLTPRQHVISENESEHEQEMENGRGKEKEQKVLKRNQVKNDKQEIKRKENEKNHQSRAAVNDKNERDTSINKEAEENQNNKEINNNKEEEQMSTARIADKLEKLTERAATPIDIKNAADKQQNIVENVENNGTTPGSIAEWKEDKVHADEEEQKNLASAISKGINQEILAEEANNSLEKQENKEQIEKRVTIKEPNNQIKKHPEKASLKISVEKVQSDEQSNMKSSNRLSSVGTRSKKASWHKNAADVSPNKSSVEENTNSRRTSVYTFSNDEINAQKGGSRLVKNKNEGEGSKKESQNSLSKNSNLGIKGKNKFNNSISKEVESEESPSRKISHLEGETSVESPKQDLSGILNVKGESKEDTETSLTKKLPNLTRKRTLSKKFLKKSSMDLSPNSPGSPLNNTNEIPNVETEKSLAISNGPDQLYPALGTLQKIEEVPQEDTLSARLKKIEETDNSKLIIHPEILADPVTLFNQLKEENVDQQTKLDLYLYGSRKQALKEYLHHIDANVEMNILAQKDCQDQLKIMFDTGLSNLVTKNNLAFSNKVFVPAATNTQWEDPNIMRTSQEHRKSFMERKDVIDLGPEILRKKNFMKQADFVSQIKTLENKVIYDLLDKITINESSSNKREIVLSKEIMDALLARGNELTNDGNMKVKKQNNIETQPETTFEQKIEAVYIRLQKLRIEKPEAFAEIMEAFKFDKEHYESALEDYRKKKLLLKGID